MFSTTLTYTPGTSRYAALPTRPNDIIETDDLFDEQASPAPKPRQAEEGTTKEVTAQMGRLMGGAVVRQGQPDMYHGGI